MFLSKPTIHRWACLFWLYLFFFSLPLSKTAVDYSVLFAFISYVWYRLILRDTAFFKDSLMKALAVFILICFASVFAAGPYFDKSMKAFFLKWCQNFAVFIMTADLLRKESVWKIAQRIILVSLAIVLLDGLIQLGTGREWLLNRPMAEIRLVYPDLPAKLFHAVTATFKHCNDFSVYLVFFALYLLASFQRKKTLEDVLRLAGIASSVLLIIFTYSRGAWVAFLAGVVIYFIFAKKTKTQVALGILMIVATLAADPVWERLVYSLKAYGDSERFELTRLTWEIIQRSPWVGNGLGTFMDYSSLLSGGRIVKYAHNCFLQIWAESGLFALLAFLIFAGLLLKKGYSYYLKFKDKETLALAVALSAYLIHALFDTQLYSLQLSALFWGMSGLMMARVFSADKTL